MKLGFNIPQIGPAASLEAIIKAAKRAEELGYDSVWVTERLLYPIEPQTSYMATPDGLLPEAYKIVIDPLHALTLAAAHTSRIGLGTSVLDMPYYNPVMLARSLTAVDVISHGRLKVGFGQGWSKDEHEATGASMKDRGSRADEFIQVLKAIWTTDPVEHHGKFFHIPKSIIGPKPVQKPHPPIYLAAYAPSSMKRVATMGDGWQPAGTPADVTAQMMGGIRDMAKQAGRNPSDLKLVVRANLNITSDPVEGERWICTGSLDQIKSDIQALKNIGTDELFFDPSVSPDGASLDRFLSTMERMKQLADEA